ncbi:MAG: hypothetical protein H7235_08950 [Bdellovibrionaceae bacterium]|nr:hypothetical protein [Pseudobdellovibrionaceae bacterium]
MISFKSFAGIFLIFLILLSAVARARVIELEFEKVEEATHYQFEFRKQGETDILKTVSQETVFVEIDLAFDHYEYRQRAYDRRNVPGEWSPWEPFTVSVPELKIFSPLANSQLEGSAGLQIVKIDWRGAEGVQKFKVVAKDLVNSRVVAEQTIEDRSVELKLPAGSLFEVEVSTVLIDSKTNDLEAVAKTQFSIQAEALPSAEIKTEKSKFMREISWMAEPLAESYEVIIERYSTATKKWSVVLEDKVMKTNRLEFNPNWAGGNYRIKIKSQAKYRKASPVHIEKFYLASDRSPAAEYNESVTRAIDRVDGYYSQISWLMTQMRISSENLDTGTQASTKPLGGTIRGGIGYFKFNSEWGISGFLNSTRMILNNQNKDFASADVNAAYRTRFSFRDELRVSLGLSDLQVPVLIGDNSLNQFNIKNSNVLGPRLAAEYWYSLGPKIGLQINGHQNFYSGISNSSAPNGNNLKLTRSYQLGLMASYKVNSKVTGLLGLIHQEENYEYEALARSGPQPISAGDLNRGALKADYIGLMVEIGL